MDMRTLIDLIETVSLDESTGGIARRWIEIQGGQEIPFLHDSTKESYTITNVTILPEDPLLRYEDTPQIKGTVLTDQAIQAVKDQLSSSPIDTKIFGDKNGRAAMVVVLQNDKGDNFVYARKARAKRGQGPNAIFWQTTDFAKETGLRAQTAQMKKAAVPIEPTDFVQAGKKYPIDRLIPAVATGLASTNLAPELKTGLPQLLKNVQAGSTTPIPGLAEFQSAIEIKLSELAAPLAMKYGNFMTGDYDTVDKNLLGPMGTSWKGATAASFPPKAEKLIDATMWFGTEKVDISVKDSSGGGRPSTATIAETLEKSEFSPKFKSKNKDYIDAINVLDAESGIQGPLTLAVKYGALTPADLEWLLTIYNKGVKEVPKIPANWKTLLAAVPYQPDDTHPEYQLGFHLLAVAAKWVSNHLNEDSGKITDFFKEVLNKSSLVQVYAKTKADKEGGLFYSQFNVVWPPVFEGIIQVDANSYTARTKPSRKVSFSFSNSKKKDQTSTASVTASATKKLEKQTKSHKVADLRPRKAEPTLAKSATRARR